MQSIPLEFEDFIKLDCDRKVFITTYLKERGVETAVISINQKNHIYVKFPRKQYNPLYKIKTVIAHYDRVSNTFGANDNSAAVFCLMQAAVTLYKSYEAHNIRLIFTDGEEMGQNSINEQGSYDLALLFKKLNIINDDIFVFDCMGRGDIPLISKINFPKNISSSFLAQYENLEKKAEKLLSQSNSGRFCKIQSDYSDNISFLVNGIAAVAISLLPSNEIEDAKNGKKVQTWSYLHTPKDDLRTLWPKSFEITKNIIFCLAKLRFILD